MFEELAAVVTSEEAALLALIEACDSLRGVARHQAADLVEGAQSALAILGGNLSGLEDVDLTLADRLRGAVSPDSPARWDRTLEELRRSHPEISLVTVLDLDYPVNLRQTYDRTPFLFVVGKLSSADDRAVAVVGTRRPSPDGMEQAARLAAGLAHAGVTVVSGLAEGIDTAAHTAALDAGGRTVAVLGHGIIRDVYPKSNSGLATRIASDSQGAVVSQFWPSAPPTVHSFPIRNVTTSGLSLGTVVVEAGETSGARQQARKCLEHGKQLFLVRHLVAHQEWARRYSERPGVVVVDDVSEVLTRLDALVGDRVPVQLTLG